MQRDPEVPQGRRPKNPAEGEFFDQAADEGWLLSTRGWPDFFLKRGDAVCAVEVKPSFSRALRREQARVMAALAAAGIPCFVWSPDGGLQKIRLGDRGQLVVFDVNKSLTAAVTGGESEGNRPAAELAIDAPAPATAPKPTAALPSQSDTAAAIDAVWAVYVRVMNPRNKEVGDDERVIIRNCLKVASAADLIVCIEECERSDYHMRRGRHISRKGGKYNSLAKIIKHRPKLGETPRSRIDWWLDRSESSGVAEFPSADAAIVNQRQVEVQRGHQSDDPEMVKKAKDAEAWLATHGIETVRRRSDGYPTFRHVGSDTE